MNEDIIHLVKSSKYIRYADAIGLDSDAIQQQVFLKLEKAELDNFVNRSEGLLSPNSYVENLVFEQTCKYLYENRDYKDSVIFEQGGRIDIKSVIACSNSLIERPNTPLPADTISGFREPDKIDGFVRIARFEKQLQLKKFGSEKPLKSSLVFEGLLPVEKDINPLIDEQSINIWDNCFISDSPFIVGLCHTMNSIEASDVIWINSLLLDMLGLTLDDYKNGLRALNSDNEVAIQYRCWKKQLIGNGASFVGTDSNIAKLEGCDLIMREDYFLLLSKIISSIKFFTKKIN